MAIGRGTGSDGQGALQTALEASGFVGFWETDLATETIHLRGPFSEFVGFDARQVAQGAPLAAFVAGIHVEDRDRITTLIHQAHRSAGRFEAEFRTSDPDGEVHWVSARGQVQTDADGAGTRCLGVVVDVTDTRPRDASIDEAALAISRIVETVIGVRSQVRALDNTTLWTLIDLVLFELGRELAHRKPDEGPNIQH